MNGDMYNDGVISYVESRTALSRANAAVERGDASTPQKERVANQKAGDAKSATTRRGQSLGGQKRKKSDLPTNVHPSSHNGNKFVSFVIVYHHITRHLSCFSSMLLHFLEGTHIWQNLRNSMANNSNCRSGSCSRTICYKPRRFSRSS